MRDGNNGDEAFLNLLGSLVSPFPECRPLMIYLIMMEGGASTDDLSSFFFKQGRRHCPVNDLFQFARNKRLLPSCIFLGLLAFAIFTSLIRRIYLSRRVAHLHTLFDLGFRLRGRLLLNFLNFYYLFLQLFSRSAYRLDWQRLLFLDNLG